MKLKQRVKNIINDATQQPATQAVDKQSVIQHNLTITTKRIYTNSMNDEGLVRQKLITNFRRTKNDPGKHYL